MRKLYKHPFKTFGTEKISVFYSNKQIEIEENYIDGKLNGDRKIWYTNGVLFAKQNYKMDALHGKSEWFYPSGQIQKEDFFVNGKPAQISRVYYDSVTIRFGEGRIIKNSHKTEDSSISVQKKVQLWLETVFDSYGREIVLKEYDLLGKIRSERFIEPEKNQCTSLYYHDNGLIAEISHSLNHNDYGHYQRYDKDGMPSMEGDYDEKGGIIKKNQK